MFDEKNTSGLIDDFRIFVFGLIDGLGEDDYNGLIEVLISELEQMPAFEDLP